MAEIRESGPILSWTTVISTAAFLLAIVGGGWTVFQTQFGSLSGQISRNEQQIIAGNSLMQAQLDRRFGEMDTELRVMKRERITKSEFDQFSSNIINQIETIRKQLSVLEQTRPTTGELQASSKGSLDTSSKLEDRVRALEQYLLGQSKAFAPTRQ